MSSDVPRIAYRSVGIHDISGDVLGSQLQALARDCITQQKNAAAEVMASFQPRSDATELVSEQALEAILQTGNDVHGIASESDISNVITFGASHIRNAVHSEDVARKRARVDEGVARMLRQIFTPGEDYDIRSSGHFWYPKGAWMGWHTNSRAPGWRIYINHAEEEGESFFRYRDPRTGKIHTLIDGHWNLRVFRVTNRAPLWHCVYSNTNRFSLGYMIPDTSLRSRMASRLRRLMARPVDGRARR